MRVRRDAACLLLLVAAVASPHPATAGHLSKGHGVKRSFGIPEGRRAPCSNEGEKFDLNADLQKDWSDCFSCICKNGFVECRTGTEQCGQMEDCAVTMPRLPSQPACCTKCKPCWFNGTEHDSHTEWGDNGQLYRCEAGVVTISRPECYSPCDRPKHHQQRHTHYNCPVCDECIINGQPVGEGRDVRVFEEPCLSCRCVHGALSCAKRACPVLPCPVAHQYTPQGDCCPKCLHPMADKILPITGTSIAKPCIIGKEYHAHNSRPFRLDPCTDCSCQNGTAVCNRHTCPVLTCGTRALPPAPGKCCPECPKVEEAKAACVVGGKTYQDGQTWQLDACKSCECHGGEPRCAMERCPAVTCPADQTLRDVPGQCCPKCVHLAGVCTVFGDPHYKTFDGKFYSFQGSCKYQLVSDCVNNSFSIRISNDARNTTHSSWTRTATLRIGASKINMGKKMRVKVNSQRVTLPYKLDGVADIKRTNGYVELKADVGVQVLWDGDGFIEVTVSSAYKGKLCGLCGNFNSLARDDMKTRDGRHSGDAWRFGTSWRVGGKKSCTRRPERPAGGSRCRQSRARRARRLCRGFDQHEALAECRGKVNPHHYSEACVQDACGCTGSRCHCAAYRAYVRECSRLGAAPAEGWARAAWCAGEPPPPPPRAAADPVLRGAAGLRRRDPSASRTRPPPPILL